MLLLCESDVAKVYDDGDNYRIIEEDREDKLMPKKKYPYFPLACCLKWGMTPVNIDYLNELSKTNIIANPEKE